MSGTDEFVDALRQRMKRSAANTPGLTLSAEVTATTPDLRFSVLGTSIELDENEVSLSQGLVEAQAVDALHVGDNVLVTEHLDEWYVHTTYSDTTPTAKVLSTDVRLTDSRYPKGPAGGDLAGTYPNPTIKASVGLTGTPTSTTAAPDTNTTQIATTAFVIGQGYLKSAAAAAAYQPLDGDLTAVAGLAATGIVTRTAANTMVARTIGGTAGQITVTNGDGVAGAPVVALAATITQTTTFSQALTGSGGFLIGAALAGTPAYQAQQVAAQTVIRNKLLAADANDAFHILGSGKHEWGPGGATAVDLAQDRDTSGRFRIEGTVVGDTVATIRNKDATGFSGWQFNDQNDVGRAFVGWANNATTASQYLRLNPGAFPLRLMYNSTDAIRIDAGPAIGFFNKTPQARPAAYTLNAGTTARSLPVGATALQIEAVVRQLLTDLIGFGLFQ